MRFTVVKIENDQIVDEACDAMASSRLLEKYFNDDSVAFFYYVDDKRLSEDEVHALMLKGEL